MDSSAVIKCVEEMKVQIEFDKVVKDRQGTNCRSQKSTDRGLGMGVRMKLLIFHGAAGQLRELHVNAPQDREWKPTTALGRDRLSPASGSLWRKMVDSVTLKS
jgi:hypothetical protein